MTLEEVNEGINKNLKISITKYCSKCIDKCDNCQGRGIINQVRHMGVFTQMFTGTCDNCGGQGTKINTKPNCDECGGKGTYDKEQNAFLSIPPGVDDGFKTVFPDLGEQPKTSNQLPGDLILEIKIAKHDLFTRNGNDLLYKYNIDFIDSVIGKTIEIPIFKETITINTDNFGVLCNGKHYIVENKGLPLMNSNTKKGNLIIEFTINYPKIKNRTKINELKELLVYTLE
jgi:DnaJ-class molecular chaperone